MAGAGDSEIQELLEQIHLKEKAEAVRKKHTFWESQPVKQFTEEENDGEGVEEGPVQTLASQDVSQGKARAQIARSQFQRQDLNRKRTARKATKRSCSRC